MKPKRLGWLMLVAVQTLAVGGCATSKLWQEGQFACYHEPASPPHLLLCRSNQSQDVLVQYDESRESDDSIRRRAYWLKPNVERSQQRRRPRFISVERAQGLTPVPIADAPVVGATPPPETMYALVSTNGHAFALLLADRELGTYELPVYADASGRVKQVLLTPITVAADLTIVGGVVVCYCLPYFWTSLNCLTH